MISTVSTFAPAGVLGQGSAVAPRVTVRRAGVPTAWRRDVITGVTCAPHGEFTAQLHARDQFQNDGTTLGFHPSSRPQS